MSEKNVKKIKEEEKKRGKQYNSNSADEPSYYYVRSPLFLILS